MRRLTTSQFGTACYNLTAFTPTSAKAVHTPLDQPYDGWASYVLGTAQTAPFHHCY